MCTAVWNIIMIFLTIADFENININSLLVIAHTTGKDRNLGFADPGVETMAAVSAHPLSFRPASLSLSPCVSLTSSSSLSLPSPPSNPRRLSFSTLDVKRSPLVARAAKSPSDFNQSIGEILSDVSIFAVSTGESIMFKDLWDQKEVKTISLFYFLFFS